MIQIRRAYLNLIDSQSSFLVFIILLKIFITCFAVYIYSLFTPFLDAEHYLNTSLENIQFSLSSIFNRTTLTGLIYAIIKLVLISKLMVHLFISITLGFVLWFIIKDEYAYCDKPLLFSCILLPHFLIWSGVVGKEALAIMGFFLLIKVCVDLIIWEKISFTILILGLSITLIERPHYTIAYIFLMIISLLVVKSKIRLMKLFSLKNAFVILLCISCYILYFLYCFNDFYGDYLSSQLIKIQQYFWRFTESNTNRWDVNWGTLHDFAYNLIWGLPSSIIGPTWSESLTHPQMLPVFLEGCFSLLLLLVIFIVSLRFIKKYPDYITIILVGFFPAVAIALLINYPWGIFNPGSAIRYKQSITPLLYLYPILLIAAHKRKSDLIKYCQSTLSNRE